MKRGNDIFSLFDPSKSIWIAVSYDITGYNDQRADNSMFHFIGFTDVSDNEIHLILI